MIPKPRRPWALPLVPLYAAGLALANALRPRAKSLTWPVLSLGSLSAGGAGKTPATIALAELLAANGWSPTILSRGYGRATPPPEIPAEVNPFAPNAATIFGDEPTLIARRTGLPVWVAAERYTAGLAAEAQYAQQSFAPTTEQATTEAAHPPIFLLDDGFQHRRLARSLDILLLTAADLDDMLLPAGNLREPLRALRRADVLLLREEEAHAVTRRLHPPLPLDLPVWLLRRTLRFPEPLKIFGAGVRPMAFCGLARPEGFPAMLTAAGCGVVDTLAFPDHHAYTVADIDHITATAKQLNGTGFITTEKDAVKLTPVLRDRLEAQGPLMVVALEAAFTSPDSVLQDIAARLQ
jgi:tetraacyldisaccharide 4'-kinase